MVVVVMAAVIVGVEVKAGAIVDSTVGLLAIEA